MKFRIKPKPWQRLLHDSYASLPAPLKPPLDFVSIEEIKGSCAPQLLQKAGRSLLTHDLESAFHGQLVQSEQSWPERFLYTFSDVRLCGDQARIFFDGASTIGPGTYVWAEKASKVRRPLPGAQGRPCGHVFHLTGEDHNNRAHFLFEYMPRLYSSRKIRSGEARLLVAPGHSKWQASYLDLLNIQPDLLLEGSPGTLRAAQVEFVPLLGGEHQYPHIGDIGMFRAMLQEIHENIRSKGRLDDASPSQGTSLLWISRRDAPMRRVANEDELIAVAQSFYDTVRVVCLSEVSLREQIRLVHQFDCIVGAHGQGLHLTALTRGKQVLILDQGKQTREQSWGAAFRNVAELAGNRALCLHNGTRNAGLAHDWVYPKEKFTSDLRKLAQLAQTSLGTS